VEHIDELCEHVTPETMSFASISLILYFYSL
jgi:hypothetical protein